jgi:transcriptional regulator with XRE-family HTH domain
MRKLRIKEVLAEKNVSMNKLSRGADVPLTTIRRMVHEPDFNPTARTLMKVAEYLGVTMDYLYTDNEKESPDAS